AALLRESGLASANAPVFITLGVVSWTTMARVIRGKVLTLREQEFVQAARAIGARPSRILVRHILPNVVGVVIVLVTLTFAQMIVGGGQPARGGTLHWATNQQVRTLDPDVGNDEVSIYIIHDVYDSLVGYEPSDPDRRGSGLKLVPHLASSWTVSPDHLDYV